MTGKVVYNHSPVINTERDIVIEVATRLNHGAQNLSRVLAEFLKERGLDVTIHTDDFALAGKEFDHRDTYEKITKWYAESGIKFRIIPQRIHVGNTRIDDKIDELKKLVELYGGEIKIDYTPEKIIDGV